MRGCMAVATSPWNMGPEAGLSSLSAEAGCLAVLPCLPDSTLSSRAETVSSACTQAQPLDWISHN